MPFSWQYNANNFMHCLDSTLGDGTISRGLWSLCLPNLNMCYFCLWSMLQYKAYINTLRTGDADLRFYITTVQDG